MGDEVKRSRGAPADRPSYERVPPEELSVDELLRELASVHRTRHATLRHGSDHALEHHNRRTEELEREYLRRFPDREVDPQRLTEVVRHRPEHYRTGAEQPWEPADFAVAAGKDPTPENVEWARRVLAEEGEAAIERIVP